MPFCCHGNDMVQMRNVSESHSFPNFRSEEPQPSRSLGATCSLNPWPDTCWYFQSLGAKRTVHERASFDSLQFTHCTRTTGQCRTTQRGKSQFDTCQHPAPFILLGIQAIKDVWPPLSRDILYWLRPQKLKGWLYFVLRFYHIIYRYVRIYFIYLHHATFSMFANQATIAQMFPHAAQGGRRGCRYFWEWAFPKGFLGKTWNPGSNVNGDIRLEFTDHGIKSDESGDVAHSCEHIQKTGHPSICPFTAE